MSNKVDVFIPVAAGHAHVLPAAIYSALTQTYSNKRIVLFLDDIHVKLESVVKKWFYTSNDSPKSTPQKRASSRTLKPEAIDIEHCEKGLIVRNCAGPGGTAHVARQWLFGWRDKSEYVKMLDADDIMTPRALEIMMNTFKEDVDGVFCPLVRTSSYRFAEIISGKPQLGHAGSGSMLLKKHVMETMIEEGFEWPGQQGHDKGFFQFLSDREEKFKFVTTSPENVLYLYLR